MPSDWLPIPRPSEVIEQRLVQAIMEGEFQPGKPLPGERELAAQLGVTRPTLRETLQRLARDGWLTIQQGKQTVVNDYWWQGNLNVLAAIVRHARQIPPDFVPNLLQVRSDLAPSYARTAVERHPDQVAEFLASQKELTPDHTPERFATLDWQLHRLLIRAASNPIYMLIFNGFDAFYVQMAQVYFRERANRASSAAYYVDLCDAAQRRNPLAAEELTRQVMQDSIGLWRQAGLREENSR